MHRTDGLMTISLPAGKSSNSGSGFLWLMFAQYTTKDFKYKHFIKKT